jgi:hypothetical protein
LFLGRFQPLQLMTLAGLITPRAVPAEIRAILALNRTGAVMIRAPEPPNKRFGLFSTAEHGPRGNCHYRSRSGVKHIGLNGRSEWNFDATPGNESDAWSYLFLALTRNSCPPQNDAAYVDTHEISDAEFLTVMHA